MKKRVQKISLFLCLCLLFTYFSPIVASASTGGISVREYLENNSIELKEGDQLYLAKLRFGPSFEVAAETANPVEAERVNTALLTVCSDLYGIVIQSLNRDGTYTERVICNLNIDENNTVTSDLCPENISQIRSITVDHNGETVKYKLSQQSILVPTRSQSYQGFLFDMSATYYRVNMVNYGGTGRAYAPISSSFCITRNAGSANIGAAHLQTHLASLWAVQSSNPYLTAQISGPYIFVRSYSTYSPLLGYNYYFDDYTYYCLETDDRYSYEGLLISLVFDGQYFLQTLFTIDSTSYYIAYDIDRGTWESGMGWG